MKKTFPEFESMMARAREETPPTINVEARVLSTLRHVGQADDRPMLVLAWVSAGCAMAMLLLAVYYCSLATDPLMQLFHMASF